MVCIYIYICAFRDTTRCELPIQWWVYDGPGLHRRGACRCAVVQLHIHPSDSDSFVLSSEFLGGWCQNFAS